jgi:hypothetical protein
MAWVQQGLLVGLVAGVAASAGVWLVQPNGPGAPPTLADAAARLEKRFESLEKLTPGPGLFMTSAQMHFAKLYYAVQLDLVRWGVSNARRGWLEKADVLNTIEDPDQFLKALHGSRR